MVCKRIKRSAAIYKAMLMSLPLFSSLSAYGAKPIQISTKAELIAFANRVNKGEGDLDAELVANISMADTVFKSGIIGTTENPYKGHFNGKWHKISGLKYETEHAKHIALFAYAEGAIIDSLHVEATMNLGLNAHTNGCGGDESGGIVGHIKGGAINHCSFSGFINGEWLTNIGGVCGHSEGANIYACANYAILNTDASTNIGGVCGKQSGSVKIESCYNKGEVDGDSQIAGIVGKPSGNVDFCLNLGHVGHNGTKAGGAIMGDHQEGLNADNNFYLEGSADYSILTRDSTGAKRVKADELKNGKVGFLLCSFDPVWGQKLGTDDTPVLYGPMVYNVECDVKGNGKVNGLGYNNAPIKLTAVPDEGIEFRRWSGDYESKSAELTITKPVSSASNSIKLNALFSEIQYGKLYEGSDKYKEVKLDLDDPFVPEGNQILEVETNEQKGTNVVYNGRCSKFLVKDGTPFYTPFEFTADTVEYDRQLQNWNVYSFCLPFSIKAGDLGGNVYELTSMKDDGFYFTSVTGYTVANRPYLISTKGEGGKVLPKGVLNATIKTGDCEPNSIGSGVSHFGTYKTEKFTTGEGKTYYAIKGGKMTRANAGVTITNNPFRTTFLMEGNKSMKPAYPLMFDGELGAAPNIVNDEEVVYGDVYDMNGRTVLKNVDLATALNSGLPNGIFVLNGSKIQVREGKASASIYKLKTKNTTIISE